MGNFTETNITKLNELQYFGVSKLSNKDFYNCPQLIEITLPANCVEIADGGQVWTAGQYGCFNKCTELVSVHFNEKLKKIGSSSFFNLQKLAITSLADSVESIGQYAFYGCSALAQLTLPANLKRIDKAAFQNCSNLEIAELPAGLTSIDGAAFQGCSKLAITSIPSGVTIINDSAFRGCKIPRLTLPEGLTAINGQYTFLGCPITDVWLPSNPPTIAYKVFPSAATFHCKAGTKSAYLAADVWKEYDASKFVED